MPVDLPAALPATLARHTAEYALTERIQAEIALVRDLATLHPAEGAAWPRLADEAAAVWARVVADGGSYASALAGAEAVLAPVAAVARSYTVHCVGHAHIDMNWQWPWNETVATTIDTVRAVLRLMDEFPGFCFSQSQTSIYEILRVHAPDLLRRVKAHLATGRWEVTASHWVEGERNTAGAEAIVRQLVRTRAWMQEHLGLGPEDVCIDWVPDCFGHAATIPAIDARAGVRHYYIMRSGGIDRPAAFWWRSPDGARVLVCREVSAQGYNHQLTPDLGRDLATFARSTGGREWMCVYGVGDHGGGPTRRSLARLLDMAAWPVWPRCEFSTSRRFFAALEKLGDRLPTWDRELNSEYSGCLVSQSAIKRANRQAENALVEADAAAALAAAVASHPVPQDQLTAAWQDALLTHFHDILPGSGVAATRHYTLGQTQGILARVQSLQSDAVRAIAGRVDTAWVGAPAIAGVVPALQPANLGAGSGFVVGNTSAAQTADGWPIGVVALNPSPWQRDEIVTLRIWEGHQPFQPGARPAFGVRDAAGRISPAQHLGSGRYWGHQWIEVAVPISVPAGGWNTYAVIADPPHSAPAQSVVLVKELEGNRNHPPAVPLPSTPFGFENQHLSVRFDRRRGGIASLIHRASGRQFVPAGACLGLPEIAVERPYPMSAWIISDVQSVTVPVCESLDSGAEGPLLTTVIARFRHGDSRITLTWSLAADARDLRLKAEVRWLEHGSAERGSPRLSLRFPLALSTATAIAEIPFGTIVRAEDNGRTMPCLRQVTVQGAEGHAILANDGVSNYALDRDGVVVHLLRSSYDPDPLPEIGDHAWNLRLAPGPGAVAPETAYRLGVETNHALRWAITDAHAGPLPAQGAAALTASPATSVITQVKPAEDGDGIIVRLQELAGRTGRTVVGCEPAIWGAITAAVAVDLLERARPEVAVALEPRGFSCDLGAHAIASVRVRFNR